MKVKLTDKELIALGYDEPDQRQNPVVVRSIVRKCKKRLIELDSEEAQYLRSDASYLLFLLSESYGVSPHDAAVATRLKKKLGID